MELITLPSMGMMGVNCYILGCENEAAVIDPPCMPDTILQKLRENGLALRKILLTHGHFDHIGAVAALVRETNCEVFIHKDDRNMLTDNSANLSRFFGFKGTEPCDASILLSDGDVINLGGTEIRVMHTPGHSPGSVCFFCEKFMFSGDTLFCSSVGRTDVPGGCTETLQNSLLKIKNIPENYIVYPGHGGSTDLFYEKETNPYLHF